MSAERVKVVHVVGARPNFVKVAPVVKAAEAWNAAPDCSVTFENVLVHTGQHYAPLLSDVFFTQLSLPAPDEHLGVGSGSHAQQTARLMEALEPALLKHHPDIVLVPGDVNSTLAASLVAAKLCVPVAHLEAGLRSGDREMPEEVNRIVADHLAELLLTTCADADKNLRREGVPADQVVRVGNTMIDSLFTLLEPAQATVAATRRRLGVIDTPYVLVTLHRPSNVDDQVQLRRLLEVLSELSAEVAVVFPVHPRTRAALDALGGGGEAAGEDDDIRLADPFGYLEFLGLMTTAAAVLTDSGGVQEETTALGVPCVTVRTTTERPITVTEGTNRMASPDDPAAVLAAMRKALATGVASPPPRLDLWDGHAGERVVEALSAWALRR